ncbi:MAG: hypothetical protein A2787_06445 [Omnitrophica WOR_2 bacterium RIFCSPHIGHO2_01_FULL_48_9]|nr:MAG: hypothetical protein A3D10_09190 [Omnitrophica WOR_2 bacterium RIFCSPHIGHO2_02_FULL_48_11]OGX31293.1 MAG: hypothetical protein A2787_06445 [Omnitrophica WOR_2 bacterium RIFCSPHIGHO2_01_FULL_48_9]
MKSFLLILILAALAATFLFKIASRKPQQSPAATEQSWSSDIEKKFLPAETSSSPSQAELLKARQRQLDAERRKAYSDSNYFQNQ